MAHIADFLKQIRSEGIKIDITADSRGISPGGTMMLDLHRDTRIFATLALRTIHKNAAVFDQIDSYEITHLTIDNAEVINLRRKRTASDLWKEVHTLIQDRHFRAKAFVPHSNNDRYQHRRRHHHPHHRTHRTNSQNAALPSTPDSQHVYTEQASPRYKPRYRRRFPDHYYPTT